MVRRAILQTARSAFRGRGLLSVAGLAFLCAALFTIGLFWGLLGCGGALVLIDFMRDKDAE